VINKLLKKGEKETNIKIRKRNIPKRETAFVNLTFKNSQREMDEIKATRYVKYWLFNKSIRRLIPTIIIKALSNLCFSIFIAENWIYLRNALIFLNIL